MKTTAVREKGSRSGTENEQFLICRIQLLPVLIAIRKSVVDSARLRFETQALSFDQAFFFTQGDVWNDDDNVSIFQNDGGESEANPLQEHLCEPL